MHLCPGSRVQPADNEDQGHGCHQTLCEFVEFGAMYATKPYEFIGFGAMDATKPCEFVGVAVPGTRQYQGPGDTRDSGVPGTRVFPALEFQNYQATRVFS